MAELSGKKLIAVDGAALNLTAIEGGIERDITAANGALEKTTFTFINDRLGTVAADGASAGGPMSLAFSVSLITAWKCVTPMAGARSCPKGLMAG